MKILKTLLLYTLFLISMMLCATAVMKIMDLVFQIGYENIWSVGCMIGFLVWLFLSVMPVIRRKK